MYYMKAHDHQTAQITDYIASGNFCECDKIN